jgi:hypothetical protein
LELRSVVQPVAAALWGAGVPVSSKKAVGVAAFRAFAAAGLTLLLAACAGTMPDPGLEPALVDPSVTSSVPGAGTEPLEAAAIDARLDGEVIGRVVSAVPFTGRPLAWENAATGSGGDVVSVSQRNGETGRICRDFSALRSSYDGLRNYGGTVCMDEAGRWLLTSFAPR